MTTPLGATSTTTPTTPSTSTSKPGDSSMGPDAFMKLLVAQLKYQNPMAPADGQAYMTQMATFTQVEKLDQLVKAQAEAQAWQQRVSAEGLVGRSVTGTVDGVITTGAVTGVRYAPGGSAVLELDGGRTLSAGLVERVQATTTSSTAPAPAPAATSTDTTSTTAPAASTPSA